MRSVFKISFFTLLISFSSFFKAQDKTVDSLKLALKNAKHDTTRCKILNAMIEAEGDDALWPKYNQELLTLAESKLNTIEHSTTEYKFYQRRLADALNNKGYLANNQGDIPKALEYCGESVKILEEIGDKQGLANSLNNIGGIYQSQGDIPKAIEHYGKSLKIREEIGDKKGIAESLNNIGFIYDNQGDIAKALEYYGKSLKIKEEIGDKQGLTSSLNNIGFIYHNQRDFPKALEYYGKSLKILEEIGDKKGLAYSLNNIGGIYRDQGDFPKALEYYGKSLKIFEEFGDKKGLAYSLSNIGSTYLKQMNYAKALEFSVRSMKISRELGFPENVREAAGTLNQIYKATGNYKLALENYELYIQMRDSINNESTRKASIRQQLKYDYERQATADSVAHAKETEIKNAELAQQKAELTAKRNQQYALFGGLALVMIFSGFIYNRFKISQKQKLIIEEKEKETQKQNEIITAQKHEVEEKQKEILDSITYARRIQRALITNEKYIEKSLNKLNSKN